MFDNLHIHRVESIKIGEIKRQVNTEGQPYYVRDIIIGDKNGDLKIHVYGLNDAGSLFIDDLDIVEDAGDGYAESMDGSAT